MVLAGQIMTKLGISQYTEEKMRLRQTLSKQSLRKARCKNQTLRKIDSQNTARRLLLLLTVSSNKINRKNRRFDIDLRVQDLQMKRVLSPLLKPEKMREANLAQDNKIKWFTKGKMRSFRKRLSQPKKRIKILEANRKAAKKAELIIVLRTMKKIKNLLNSHLLMRSSVLGIGEDPRRRESMLL